MLRDLVLLNRSFRRFHQQVPVPRDTLRELVDLARHCPSAANRQPLRYMLLCEPERTALVFPTLTWANYLQDWKGPAEGERPAAYIIILGDVRISVNVNTDLGIAAQTIMLGAAERGLGGCMIHSVQRDELREKLSIPPHYDILLVLAIGKPRETVVLEELPQSGDIRYWRDADGVHHVPKRALDDVILP